MSESFFKELRRRNVFKITGGYILLGWLVLQIADVIIPALSLPKWTLTLLLVIGMLGMPFVIFFAWLYEVTPEGLKLTKEVDKSQSITQNTGKKLEYVLIAGLSLALIFVIIKPKIMPPEALPTVTAEVADVQTKETEIPSIAVLPFEDFSPQKDQEYFSSGISEEILNLLAKTNKLRVAARTSSFAFRGDTTDVRDIGSKLNVNTVLEGSIRKFENKVRITAQLINVSDGYHIWSETYDRELKDVFAIQDEIAGAILSSLKVHLLGETLKNQQHQEINIEAHDKYLIATKRIRGDTREDFKSAIELLNQALEIDPNYTDAKIKLIYASLLLESTQLEDYTDQVELEKNNDQLVKLHLDPIVNHQLDNFELHGVLGLYHTKRYRDDVAKEYLATSLKLNNNYAEAYLWRAEIHKRQTNYKAMLKDRERAYKLDPMSINISKELAYDYRSFWRSSDANKIIERMFVLYPNHPEAFKAKASNYSAHGHYADAAATLEQALIIHPDRKEFKGWLGWLYVYLDKRDLAQELETERTDYYFSILDQDFEQSTKLLNVKLSEDNPEDWLFEEMYLNLMLKDKQQLKSSVSKIIALMDARNEPWQNRCYTYLILALETVEMNDSIQKMMDRCSEETEKRLEAGYFCPCSWFRLVEFAVLDKRYDDAIKRAEEWLDNGDSDPILENNPIFRKLQAKPKFETLIKRNEQQIQRQIRIYDSNNEAQSSALSTE